VGGEGRKEEGGRTCDCRLQEFESGAGGGWVRCGVRRVRCGVRRVRCGVRRVRCG